MNGAPGAAPLVSIGVVALDQGDATREAVRSLLGTTAHLDRELLLWDNGSTEPAALELLDELEADPDCRVFRSASNEGWIAPINAMAREARGDYFVGANNDIVVAPGWFDALRDAFEAEGSLAVAGPPPECGRLDANLVGRAGPGPIDYIEGYLFAMRSADARRFGPYDEANLSFAYCEDADLCFRVVEAGRTIAAVPGCRVEHRRSLTRRSSPAIKARARASEARNREYLLRRWGDWFSLRRAAAEAEAAEAPAIAVRRRAAIGDVIACEPALRALRAAHPGAAISLETRCPSVLEGCPLGVTANTEPRAGVPVIDLDLAYESRPGVPRCRAICQAAGVPYPGPPRYWVSEGARSLVAREDGGRAASGRPLLAIHAGASWPCRCWPWDRWEELARRLSGGFDLIAFGGRREPVPPPAAPVLGRPWPVVAAWVERCAGFVGVDGSLMWIATGLGIPSVVLFGPTDPDLVLPDAPTLVALSGGDECDGCHHRGRHPKVRCECGISEHPGMLAITVDAVEAAILEAVGL